MIKARQIGQWGLGLRLKAAWEDRSRLWGPGGPSRSLVGIFLDGDEGEVLKGERGR